MNRHGLDSSPARQINRACESKPSFDHFRNQSPPEDEASENLEPVRTRSAASAGYSDKSGRLAETTGQDASERSLATAKPQSMSQKQAHAGEH
jgi:hypothetical protein